MTRVIRRVPLGLLITFIFAFCASAQTAGDIELTGPHMHNGSQKTLLDVVKFYSRGGEPNSNLDERMRPLNLTDQEINDVVEFLRALTSDDVLRETQSARPQTRSSVPQ